MGKKTIYSAIIFYLCLTTTLAFGQVTIAPTNLFVNSGTQFGTYMVINGSNQNQEISINFQFAFGQTDENGERKTVSEDSLLEKKHSIADQIRAFPQNFVLNPDQRQVVRLRVNAPDDLPDGTYWARIKTTSTPESPPVEITSTDNVSARVGINIEQVTGLFYKKGNVTTGIEIKEIRTLLDENGLIVLTDLKRTGNSPFLGSITASLINSEGEAVQESFTSTSIYFDGTHRQELDLNDLPKGEYTIRLKFETRRSDISSENLVQMEPVTQTVPYTLR
ncbi:MAG: hypothetical protein WD016_12230 [Balneolaceae bacterium]